MGQLTSSNSFIWIGLHFTSGTWTWDDGALQGSDFEAFTTGVPGNPTNPCVDAHQTDGSWSTFSCTATHPTLCECDGPCDALAATARWVSARSGRVTGCGAHARLSMLVSINDTFIAEASVRILIRST